MPPSKNSEKLFSHKNEQQISYYMKKNEQNDISSDNENTLETCAPRKHQDYNFNFKTI